MKLNFLFKTLIDIAFFLMIPSIIFYPGTVLYLLFFPNQTIFDVNVPFQDNGLTLASIVYLIFLFIELVLFFLGFFNLRKLAKIIQKKRIFTTEIVLRLKRIGQFFSICGGSSIVLLMTYRLIRIITSSNLKLSFGTTETILLLFLLIIGVFFLVLSEAFKKAIAYKSENELTV